MRYQVESLPGEPIIIATVQEAASNADESNRAVDHIMELLDQQSQPAVLIFDLLGASLSLDAVVQGASIAARQRSLLRHPKLRETVVISQNRLIDLASRGLNSATFGHIKVRIFKSMDEALTYARGSAATVR